MSIVAADLVARLAASHPEDDNDAAGGAIDVSGRPLDGQFSAAAVAALISDNAGDTMDATVKGRDAAGELVSEVKALNGVTQVLTTQSFERIHSVVLASGPAGTVLLKQGSGGTTRHTFAPGEDKAAIFFIDAAADPSISQTRYEKYFWKNEHGTLSLLNAILELTTDTADLYEVAVSGAVDDTESVTDRFDPPSGETFVDDGVDQSVPGTDLAAGAAIGHWVKQTLPAAEAAAKDTFTTTIFGQTV